MNIAFKDNLIKAILKWKSKQLDPPKDNSSWNSVQNIAENSSSF